jgi:hypothetical protein
LSLYDNIQSYRKGDGDIEKYFAKMFFGAQGTSTSRHVRNVLEKKRKEHRYQKVKPSEKHRARQLSN